MIFRQAEIQAIQKGDWEVGCAHMTLSQDAAENPKTITGSGYLRRDQSGQIRFKLLSTGTTSFREAFFSHLDVDPGTLASESSYYSLRAEGMDQRIWEAARIIPNLSEVTVNGTGQQEFTGTIQRLSSNSNQSLSTPGTYIQLIVQTNAAIPWNSRIRTQTSVGESPYVPSVRLAATSLTSQFGQFTMRQEDGVLRIEVVNNAELPAAIESRIEESLTFILATPLAWSILIRNDHEGSTVALRSVPPENPSSPLMPRPIAGDIIEQNMNNEVWELFEHNLTHICAHNAEERHPFSQQVLATIQASAADITSWGLALSIAVESITNLVCPKASDAGTGRKCQIQSLREFCLGWEGFSETNEDVRLQKRLRGFFDSMPRQSTKDKLYAIAKAGSISDAYIRSWSKLRNALAHGAGAAGNNQQNFVDMCYQVSTLMYQLLFKAVGYTGRYKDYGTRGWPVKSYPPDH